MKYEIWIKISYGINYNNKKFFVDDPNLKYIGGICCIKVYKNMV